MALVHRVNMNVTPLLSTFYCKCIVNITRFKTEYNLKKQTKSTHDEELPKDYKTFEQMITFRQSQAQKSIIVRISSLDSVGELEKFCSRYGKITDMFPYSTLNDKSFVLVELESKQQVEAFQDIATYRLDSDCVETVSPLFYYKCSGYSNIDKLKLSKTKQICHYSNFAAPASNTIVEQLQPMKTVSEQMTTLYDTLKVTDLNIRLRFYTAEQMSYYLSRLYTNLSVVPFGSSVNGFGQLGCDLDLLCRTSSSKIVDNSWKKFLFLAQPVYLTDRIEQKEFLESVGVILKTCVPGINNIKKILEARVPIIKFFNMNTNMQCDLSSTNMVALHMSELLYMYGELDWRVKPLVCTIRKWARSKGVTKENAGHWITNFSLTLLIIFYLQTRNILPSLNAVKYYAEHIRRTSKTSSSDLAWFLKWKESIKYNNDESLHNLLYGFFEYYSIFDFKMQAICIREARLKAKKDSSALYIYNPFDSTLNVSKNITLLELSRIIEHFRNALHILLEADECNTIMKLLNVKPLRTTSRQMALASHPETDQQNFDRIYGHTNEKVAKARRNELTDENLLASESVTKPGKNMKESIIK